MSVLNFQKKILHGTFTNVLFTSMLTKNVQRKKIFLLSPPLPTPNLTIVILCHSFPNVQINRLQQIHNFLACAVVKAFDCRFWYSGNTLDLINVVTLRQARLVPGWVTVLDG